jgi:4-hydroxy-tetrahydrodipicolinate synthase
MKKKKRKTNKRPCNGVVTALVTPFLKGKIDYVSVKNLVRAQLEGGVEGFVVNGTTGESPTLDEVEVAQLFKFVKKVSDDVVPIVLGTGTNSTKETIRKTAAAAKLGADAALVVVPYYNKPPQRGLVSHFNAVAKSAKLPVVLYNVPGRTVVSMAAETVATLAKNKNIIGIKEASGQISNLENIKQGVDKNFLLLSGDDATCIDFMLAGGMGVISVISHVIPAQLRALSDRARKGDISAREDYKKYNELNRLIGIEANPIPVKMMLYQMGILRSPELRLPLVELSAENKTKTQAELKRLGDL